MSVPSISALTDGISLRACTQARTKKLMKPSFTPFRFSNSSLYWLRVCITALMSTSLKVVSMAAVFWASLRRRAMVCRGRACFLGFGLELRGGLAGGGARALLDLAEQRAHSDGLAVLGGNLGQHAGGRRGHLDGYLVGFKLHQRLVDRDRIARMLEPFS